MKYTEATEKIEALLGEAKARLEMDGITVSTDTELVENEISPSESEPLIILGSLALSADGLTEDDTFYVSIEARIESDEVNDAALADAVPRFEARVSEAAERLGRSEDRRQTLLEMGKEVDDELERLYEEEAMRSQMAIKRDLKLAVIGSAAIILLVVLMVVLSHVF